MDNWIIHFIDWSGYTGIFLLMLLETVFPPIPSEVIMPVAGTRAANGNLNLGGVIAAGTAGAMVGNFIWFVAAASLGEAKFRLFVKRHGRWLTLDWYEIRRVQRAFGRWGGILVFLGRLVPTVRSVISFPAGLARMALLRFLLWSGVGTAMFSAALAVAGYLLGTQFKDVDKVIGPLSSAIFIGIILLYVWRQATWGRRHKRHVVKDPAGSA
jgi:membrane protein DedA with SNARE-associated domain